MITEDYVSFETAKLLKEKGFNEEVISYYDIEGQGCFISSREYNIGIENVYACPTLQMAMKWLREVHNLYIQTEIISWPQKGYFVKIYLYRNQYNDFEEMPFVEHKKSYEEACEAAIKYCLENLI